MGGAVTRPPVRWQPDDGSAAILAAYARSGERTPAALRRALLLLATADGMLNGRGQIIRNGRRAGRGSATMKAPAPKEQP